MTGPSSAPRGEHTPRPGVTWSTYVVWDEEHVIADDDLAALPAPGAAWSGSTATDGQPPANPAPKPNRATRRAIARRSKK